MKSRIEIVDLHLKMKMNKEKIKDITNQEAAKFIQMIQDSNHLSLSVASDLGELLITAQSFSDEQREEILNELNKRMSLCDEPESPEAPEATIEVQGSPPKATLKLREVAHRVHRPAPPTVMDQLFWQVWPMLGVWLKEQRLQVAVKWHKKRLLQVYFQRWVDEAAIFPPPLVSSSDSDSDSTPHHFGREVDGRDGRADFDPETVGVATTARQDPSWESNAQHRIFLWNMRVLAGMMHYLNSSEFQWLQRAHEIFNPNPLEVGSDFQSDVSIEGPSARRSRLRRRRRA